MNHWENEFAIFYDRKLQMCVAIARGYLFKYLGIFHYPRSSGPTLVIRDSVLGSR